MKTENRVRKKSGRLPGWRMGLLTAFLSTTTVHGWGQSDQPVSFSKKETAFLKWGNGPDEVVLKRVKSGLKRIIKSTGEDLDQNEFKYIPEFGALHVDGNDNLYFGDGSNGIYVVAADGSSIKKIKSDDFRNFFMVDSQGNIYSHYLDQGKMFTSEGKPFGFVLTKKDGSKSVYKNYDLTYVRNGVAYPRDQTNAPNGKPLTLYSVEGGETKKLSIHLNLDRGQDVEQRQDGAYIIRTKRINQRLTELGEKDVSDTITIKLEKKLGVDPFSDLLGVDDEGNSYFLCGYNDVPPITGPWKETYVMIYSSAGNKLAEIRLDNDFNTGQVNRYELALDAQGNIFQEQASKDGLCIFKWSKNGNHF